MRLKKKYQTVIRIIIRERTNKKDGKSKTISVYETSVKEVYNCVLRALKESEVKYGR